MRWLMKGNDDRGDEAEKVLYQQYEHVRQSGLTNMADRQAVKVVAETWGYRELARAAGDRKEYTALLSNYSTLAEKYGD